MKLSTFGRRFTAHSGILQLMDDLGSALSRDEPICMLGGGNPARIPEVERRFRESLAQLLGNGDAFDRTVGDYTGPQGHPQFIAALASLLQCECGWNIGPENIAITNGSQSSFFLLFNMFAGHFDDGSRRQILLPLAPEYIGYADVGLTESLFTAVRPRIDRLDEHTFKYGVDFGDVNVAATTGAICVSRPTNPTGNVLTDEEVRRLMTLASAHDVPLIIDSAYGMPFPHIVFADATPFWNGHTIVTMSLSKLGLPGIRTGIIIAREEIIRAIAGMNAILNLATGSFGPALVTDMVSSGEVLQISRNLIRPYYRSRAEQAVEWLHTELAGYPFYVHKPEGAIFLWLWFPELPISSQDLYRRLKRRGVLVIAGEHFFPGLEGEWRHQHECIRVTYSQDEDSVRSGIRAIAEEVKAAYDSRPSHARAG
ncbi:MAG TPA: valine--pyruvate transaminase [Pseudomonadales bacterium]